MWVSGWYYGRCYRTCSYPRYAYCASGCRTANWCYPCGTIYCGY